MFKPIISEVFLLDKYVDPESELECHRSFGFSLLIKD